MSLTDDLKRGMVIRFNEHLYRVLDFRVAQTGKQKPTVHVKLRTLKGGHTSEKSLDQIGKIDEVPAEKRQMQYLYAAGKEHVFMDSESFEQFNVGEDVLGGALDLLVEEETYLFLTVDGQIFEIQLPAHVALEVTDTAPVEHAGGSSSVHKDAKLSSGLTIQVPLFIKTGEKIRVNTETREYLGKDH